MKNAIIVGVLILVLSAIITPFFIGKNQEHQEVNQNEIEDNYSSEKESTNINDSNILNTDKLVSNDISDNIDNTNVYNTKLSDKLVKDQLNVENKTDMASYKEEQTNIEVVNVGAEENLTNNENINNVEVDDTENNIKIPDGMVGILKIDKIGLYQNIAEGHTLDVLKKNLGHVTDTAHFTGNIGILGHNSGNAGYFKRLTELAVGDKIEYITEKGTRTYSVSEITEIDDTDWSKLANTEENKITLITCVKNVPLKRLCVQASEI